MLQEKLSRGLTFDAVVDCLLGQSFDHDASVLVISDSEMESSPLPTPRQKKTRTEPPPAAGLDKLTDRQARCYRELQEVVSLVPILTVAPHLLGLPSPRNSLEQLALSHPGKLSSLSEVWNCPVV